MNSLDIKDILKIARKDLLTQVTLPYFSVVLSFMFAILLAFYLFFVYRIYTRKAFYDKEFNMSLPIITIIITAVIIAIQSSLVVSLGMVGALSIVRFRTAVKRPMDLSFVFWAVATGILCGTRLFAIAIIMNILLTVGLILMELLPVAKAPKLLVIHASENIDKTKLFDIIRAVTPNYTVKSESNSSGNICLIIEARCPKTHDLLANISALGEVKKCSLISHDGEVAF